MASALMITQMELPAASWVEAWESMRFRNFLCSPATIRQSTERLPAVLSTQLPALARIVFTAALMSSCGTARCTLETFSTVPDSAVQAQPVRGLDWRSHLY